MNIPDISPLYTNNWQTILGQKTFNNLISWIHEEDEITVTKNFLDLYSFVMYDYYTHEQYLQILNELEDSHVLILKNIPVVIENTYQDIIELNKQQQLYDAITSSIPLYIFLTSFENNPNLTLSTKEALE